MSELPAPTSIVKVSQALLLCLVMLVAAWLTFFLALKTNLVNAYFVDKTDGNHPSIPLSLVRKARKWHFGICSFLTCFVPAAVLWLGLVCLSYARDCGLTIIPWYIWVPFTLWGEANTAAYSTVQNCDRSFRIRCPKNWADLNPSDDPTSRWCSTCERIVTFCLTDSDIERLTRNGECVAYYGHCFFGYTRFAGRTQVIPPSTGRFFGCPTGLFFDCHFQTPNNHSLFSSIWCRNASKLDLFGNFLVS